MRQLLRLLEKLPVIKARLLKKLALLFNQLDAVLVDMDGLMSQFESTEADFYKVIKRLARLLIWGDPEQGYWANQTMTLNGVILS